MRKKLFVLALLTLLLISSFSITPKTNRLYADEKEPIFIMNGGTARS